MPSNKDFRFEIIDIMFDEINEEVRKKTKKNMVYISKEKCGKIIDRSINKFKDTLDTEKTLRISHLGTFKKKETKPRTNLINPSTGKLFNAVPGKYRVLFSMSNLFEKRD